MDKGHVYILQTIKNLEDQVLADNYTVGKELLHQTKIARELIDHLFKIKQRWAQDQMDVNAKEALEHDK